MHYNAYTRIPTAAEMRCQPKRDEQRQLFPTMERFSGAVGPRNSRVQSLKSDEHRHPVYRQRPGAAVFASGSSPRPRSVDMNLLYEEVLAVQEIDHVPSLMERYEEKAIEYDQGPLRIREETVFEETDPVISEDIVNEVHLVSGVWKYVRTLRRSRSERRMFKKLRKRSVFSRKPDDHDADRKEWEAHDTTKAPRSLSLGGPAPEPSGRTAARYFDDAQEFPSRRPKKGSYKFEDVLNDTAPAESTTDHPFYQHAGYGPNDVGYVSSTYPRFVTEITLPAQTETRGPVSIPVRSVGPSKIDASPPAPTDISTEPATIEPILSWHHELPDKKETVLKKPTPPAGPDNLSNIVSWHVGRSSVDAAKEKPQPFGDSVEQIVRWHTTAEPGDDRKEGDDRDGRKPPSALTAPKPATGHTPLRSDVVTSGMPASGAVPPSEPPPKTGESRDSLIKKQEAPLRQPIPVHHVVPVSEREIPIERVRADENERRERAVGTAAADDVLKGPEEWRPQKVPSPFVRKPATDQESPSSYFFRHKLAMEKAAEDKKKREMAEPKQEPITKSSVLITPTHRASVKSVHAWQPLLPKVDVQVSAAAASLPNEVSVKALPVHSHQIDHGAVDGSAETSSTEASQEIFYEADDVPFDKPKERHEEPVVIKEAKIVEPGPQLQILKHDEEPRPGKAVKLEMPDEAAIRRGEKAATPGRDRLAEAKEAANGAITAEMPEKQPDGTAADPHKGAAASEGVRKIIETVRDYPAKLLKRLKPQSAAPEKDHETKMPSQSEHELTAEDARASEKPRLAEPEQSPSEFVASDAVKRAFTPDGEFTAVGAKRKHYQQPPADVTEAAEVGGKDLPSQREAAGDVTKEAAVDLDGALQTEGLKGDMKQLAGAEEAESRKDHRKPKKRRSVDESQVADGQAKIAKLRQIYQTAVPADEFKRLEAGRTVILTKAEDGHPTKEPAFGKESVVEKAKERKEETVTAEPDAAKRLDHGQAAEEAVRASKQLKSDDKMQEQAEGPADGKASILEADHGHAVKIPTHKRKKSKSHEKKEERKEATATHDTLGRDGRAAKEPKRERKEPKGNKEAKELPTLSATEELLTPVKTEKASSPTKSIPEAKEPEKRKKEEEPQKEQAATEPVVPGVDHGDAAKESTRELMELPSAERMKERRKEPSPKERVVLEKIDQDDVAKKPAHESKELKDDDRSEKPNELAADGTIASGKPDVGQPEKPTRRQKKAKSKEKTEEPRKEPAAGEPMVSDKADHGDAGGRTAYEEKPKSTEMVEQPPKVIEADRPTAPSKPDDVHAVRLTHETKGDRIAEGLRKEPLVGKPADLDKVTHGDLTEKPADELKGQKSKETTETLQKEPTVKEPAVSDKVVHGDAGRATHKAKGRKSAERSEKRREEAVGKPVISHEVGHDDFAKKPAEEAEEAESAKRKEKPRKEPAVPETLAPEKIAHGDAGRKPPHEPKDVTSDETSEAPKESVAEESIVSGKLDDSHAAKLAPDTKELKADEGTTEPRKELAVEKPMVSDKIDYDDVEKDGLEKAKSAERAEEPRKEPVTEKPVISDKAEHGDTKKPAHKTKERRAAEKAEKKHKKPADETSTVSRGKPADGHAEKSADELKALDGREGSAEPPLETAKDAKTSKDLPGDKESPVKERTSAQVSQMPQAQQTSDRSQKGHHDDLAVPSSEQKDQVKKRGAAERPQASRESPDTHKSFVSKIKGGIHVAKEKLEAVPKLFEQTVESLIADSLIAESLIAGRDDDDHKRAEPALDASAADSTEAASVKPSQPGPVTGEKTPKVEERESQVISPRAGSVNDDVHWTDTELPSEALLPQAAVPSSVTTSSDLSIKVLDPSCSEFLETPSDEEAPHVVAPTVKEVEKSQIAGPQIQEVHDTREAKRVRPADKFGMQSPSDEQPGGKAPTENGLVDRSLDKTDVKHPVDVSEEKKAEKADVHGKGAVVPEAKILKQPDINGDKTDDAKEGKQKEKPIWTEAPEYTMEVKERKTPPLKAPLEVTGQAKVADDDKAESEEQPSSADAVLLEILKFHAALSQVLPMKDTAEHRAPTPDLSKEGKKRSDKVTTGGATEAMNGHRAQDGEAEEPLPVEHEIKKKETPPAAEGHDIETETPKARKRRTSAKKREEAAKEHVKKEDGTAATEKPRLLTATTLTTEKPAETQPVASTVPKHEDIKKKKPVEAKDVREKKTAASEAKACRPESFSVLRDSHPEIATSSVASEPDVSAEKPTRQLNGTAEVATSEVSAAPTETVLPAILGVLGWHKGLHGKSGHAHPPVQPTDGHVDEPADEKAKESVTKVSDVAAKDRQDAVPSNLASIVEKHGKLAATPPTPSKLPSTDEGGLTESPVKNLIHVINDIAKLQRPDRQPQLRDTAETADIPRRDKAKTLSADSDLTEGIPVQELDLDNFDEKPASEDNGYFELLERRCRDSQQFAPIAVKSPTLKDDGKLYDWSPLSDLPACAKTELPTEASSDALESEPPRTDLIKLPDSMTPTPDGSSKCEGLFGPIYGEYATGYKKVFGPDDSGESHSKVPWEESVRPKKETVTEHSVLDDITQSLGEVIPAYDHAIQTIEDLTKTMDRGSVTAPSAFEQGDDAKDATAKLDSLKSEKETFEAPGLEVEKDAGKAKEEAAKPDGRTEERAVDKSGTPSTDRKDETKAPEENARLDELAGEDMPGKAIAPSTETRGHETQARDEAEKPDRPAQEDMVDKTRPVKAQRDDTEVSDKVAKHERQAGETVGKAATPTEVRKDDAKVAEVEKPDSEETMEEAPSIGAQRDDTKAKDQVAKPDRQAEKQAKHFKQWLTSALQYSAAICWWSTEGRALLLQYYRRLSGGGAKGEPVAHARHPSKERTGTPDRPKEEKPEVPASVQAVEPLVGHPAKSKEVPREDSQPARVESPAGKADKPKHSSKKPVSARRLAEAHPGEPPSKIPVPVAKREMRKDSTSGSPPLSSSLPTKIRVTEQEELPVSPRRHKPSSPLLKREQQLKCSYQKDLQMLRDLNSELAILLQADEAQSPLRGQSPSFKAGASELSSSEAVRHESKSSQRERTISSSERSSPFEASSATSDADSHCRHRGRRQKWKKPDIKSDATLSESYSKISASRTDDHRSTSSEAPSRKAPRLVQEKEAAEAKPALTTSRPVRNISTEAATKKLAQLLPPFCYALPGKLGLVGPSATADPQTAPSASQTSPGRLQPPTQEEHSRPGRHEHEETSYDSPFDSLVPRFVRGDADSPQPKQASGRSNDESKPRLRQRRTDNGKSPSSIRR